MRDAGIRAVAGAGESGGAYAFGVRWGDIGMLLFPRRVMCFCKRMYVG